MSTEVFINEIHYDNSGADVGEAIEIAGPAGTDLTGWTLVLYNGNGGAPYGTISLTGTIADQNNGFGTLSFAASGLQNGAPDGFALVDGNGVVIQFLSYEGSFVAVGGAADGMTSTDIGVSETGTDPVGTSLQLTGTGTVYEDFVWSSPVADSFGAVNTGEAFTTAAPPPPPPPPPAATANVWINEIHYDNAGGDVGEGVEIAGAAGTDLTGWTLVLYNGTGGAPYGTIGLSGTIADQQGGFGTVAAAFAGIQNGAPDGVALVDNNGTVVQFLSYEGSFVAVGGAADGMTSTDIGVAEDGTTLVGDSLQLVGTGSTYADFTWAAAPLAETFGAPNTGQTLATPVPNVWINEIHYDNSGSDVGEAVEVAGAAGTDLTGWSIVLYNGNGGADYKTIALTGAIDDENNGFGALSFDAAGIQNGAPDGLALVDPDGNVIQFLSYEGTMTATSGPAAGMTSTDIGVAEEPAPGVGYSLQLKGAGATGNDFTWTAASADSFGSLNDGQSFYGASDTGHLRVDDVAVAEGDSGTTDMTFTIHRAGGSDFAASVDWSVDTSGIQADDLATGSVLAGTLSFAVGETVKTITLSVVGDTVGELNETLTFTLSNPMGDVVIDDATATGTIVNDDPIALEIGQIQGAGHMSEYVGQDVLTTGVVTAVDTNGFYVQDPDGDGNALTSDAVFVYTGGAPGVAVGDGVSVRGTVAEYAGDTAGLTVTEITSPTVTVESTGNALPDAILIGADGLLPPSSDYASPNFATYDPSQYGLDFWESMEGMRVTIETPQAVSNTNSYGETWVVASNGDGATGMNDRGGITISEGDLNPERIQIDDDSGIYAGFNPNYTIGDQLTNVTGIVNYSFDSYEVIVTDAVSVTHDETLTRETTLLQSDSNFLSIATYNLENLDASDNKYDLLASDIVYNLGAPDILAVQEVQDADGAGTGTDLSGASNAQGIIDAIYALTGQHYAYIEIAPTEANSTGGEPNGNIRSGYLYNVDRVQYVEGSAELIADPVNDSYYHSRSPLVAQWNFAGETLTTVNVHFYSRGGSDPLEGATQPPVDSGDQRRTDQAAAVKEWVNEHLADDPSLNVAILGDWNGFYWEDAQTQLTDPAQGGVFTNLSSLLPTEERYSYFYDGNAQQIDHILVTDGLLADAQYDAVHLNLQLLGTGATLPSDHDPQVALLMLGQAPSDLAISNASVDENMPAGTVVGTLSATDTANDTLTYALTDDADGLFVVDAATGVVTTTAPLDFEAIDHYALVATATDRGGLSTTLDFTVAVNDVNEAPVAEHDAVAVDEDSSTNLWSQLLANDHDPDAGDTLSISAVDTTGTLGSVVFDAETQTLQYVADATAFHDMAPGTTMTDHFTYTTVDSGGLTSTATVEVTVTALDNGETVIGTWRGDVPYGTTGEDKLFGGFGKDTLYGFEGQDELHGGFGADKLFGGSGDDQLYSGFGNDEMSGGTGSDTFHFGWLGGHDTITDFDIAQDVLMLEDGVSITNTKVKDVDHDGVKDLVLTLGPGSSVTLLGVSSLDGVNIVQTEDDHRHYGIGNIADLIEGFGSRSDNPFELAHGF